MSILMHFLVPRSTAQLNFRQNQITENITARLLTEGTFLHPTEGVTFYIREITPDGVFKGRLSFRSTQPNRDLDLHSSRGLSPQRRLWRKAGDGRRFVTDYIEDGDRLFTTNFSDFTYDISRLIANRSKEKEPLST